MSLPIEMLVLQVKGLDNYIFLMLDMIYGVTQSREKGPLCITVGLNLMQGYC